MLAFKFILLVISVLIGYSLGYLLTESKYRLPNNGLFNFKAFQCRKCLSFHISWVVSTTISLLFVDWYMLIIGVVFAFMLFIGLMIDQKNKTVLLEDIE